MITERQLTDLFRAVDPLAADPSPAATEQHLSAARRVLDIRRAAAPSVPASSWRRRLVTVAAAAVALPVAATVLVPVVSERFSAQTPLAGTAYASEGGLSCGSGYAAAIRPSAADPRPWPDRLPDGWTVRDVFARSYTGTSGWCGTPSLNVVELDATETIVGSIRVTGPARVEVGDGPAPVPDRVGPYAARRFVPIANVQPPTGHDAWIVTDAGGDQWYASVDGYPTGRARELLGALTLGDGAVDWDATRTPGLRVLHRRTGAPYATRVTAGQDWYLRFNAPGGEQQLEATSGREGNRALSQATVGSRLTTVAGRPAFLFQDEGRPVAVVTDLAPGGTVYADVRGNLEQVLAMLASVRSLPADDKRLERYALDEEYAEN